MTRFEELVARLEELVARLEELVARLVELVAQISSSLGASQTIPVCIFLILD